MSATVAPDRATAPDLESVLAGVAGRAAERDRASEPAFPEDAIAALEATGALAWNAVPGPHRPPAAEELALVRAVSRADGSVGRIVDGHLNGVERLAVQAPAELRDRELPPIRAGLLRVGVWGGDPRPGEGVPATIDAPAQTNTETLSGVKTFCSGAGGLHRALVLARDPGAAKPVAVWIDLTDRDTVTVDPTWYRAPGLRASVSHRVIFDRAPIQARFGPPGAIAEQPWFGRDALRTAASWAGMADRLLDAAFTDLAERPHPTELDHLATGHMLTAHRTIGVWLDAAARAMDEHSRDLPAVALHARAGIVAAVEAMIGAAANACGSHPFATGGDLDRARRDLELFTLQHRLDPALAAAGASALDHRRRPPAR
jgi:alkylation response protein AidB-like acyl-CoA dehydrogenase